MNHRILQFAVLCLLLQSFVNFEFKAGYIQVITSMVTPNESQLTINSTYAFDSNLTTSVPQTALGLASYHQYLSENLGVNASIL